MSVPQTQTGRKGGFLVDWLAWSPDLFAQPFASKCAESHTSAGMLS